MTDRLANDAEVVFSDDFLDAYCDTTAGRCCDCPSCNYYAPDYLDHVGEPCHTLELIRAEIARQLADHTARVRAEGAAEALREAARDLPLLEAGNEVKAYAWLRDRAALADRSSSAEREASDG